LTLLIGNDNPQWSLILGQWFSVSSIGNYDDPISESMIEFRQTCS
jgi:hypothetical protein